jgi:hypothetical protein
MPPTAAEAMLPMAVTICTNSPSVVALAVESATVLAVVGAGASPAQPTIPIIVCIVGWSIQDDPTPPTL